MRKSLLLLFLITISCKIDPQPIDNDTIINNEFHWLIGDWQRLNDTNDKTTFEHWKTADSFHLTGLGYTLQQSDTIFKEDLVLYFKEKNWILEVTGVNESPTLFTIEKFTDSSFTAVNLENEFPTHIQYTIHQDTLKAAVSNKEFEVVFNFMK